MRSRTVDAVLVSWVATLAVLSGCGRPDTAPPAASQPAAPSAAPTTPAEPPTVLAGPADPEQVVAKVNGIPIRAGKVWEVAAINQAQLEASGRPLADEDEQRLRVIALGLIADDELLAQEALKVGVKVDSTEVEAEMRRIQEQYGTPQAFDEALGKMGITRDGLRSEVERKLLTQTYRRQLTAGAKVPDADAEKYYEANRDRFVEGETVEVRQILIRSAANDPQERREAARARAETARRRAAAGEDFAALAREFSQAPNAWKGGLVPHYPRGVMVPKFEEVTFAMKPGEISEVFETPYGYNVVQFVERRQARPIPFAEVRPRLLVELAQMQEAAIVQAKIEELRSHATFEILDPAYRADAEPAKPGT